MCHFALHPFQLSAEILFRHRLELDLYTNFGSLILNPAYLALYLQIDQSDGHIF